jgi:hypothetical protein
MACHHVHLDVTTDNRAILIDELLVQRTTDLEALKRFVSSTVKLSHVRPLSMPITIRPPS